MLSLKSHKSPVGIVLTAKSQKYYVWSLWGGFVSFSSFVFVDSISRSNLSLALKTYETKPQLGRWYLNVCIQSTNHSL